MANIPTLRIGVLLTFNDVQMLDLASVDLFGMMSKQYLEIAIPRPISQLGLDVQVYYIGKEDNGNQIDLTANARLITNKTLHSSEVRPGKLDILFIPGPKPTEVQTKETLDFVRLHVKSKTTILNICTGCIVAAQAGVLKGRHASGPRALVPSFRKDFPDVKWDDQRRWITDKLDGEAELWTSGGITNGLEMVAAYLKEKYPGPASETVCAMADVGDKGETYGNHVAADNAWFIGQIFRALFFGRR